MLSRTCLALLATTLIASPAVARDKTLYLGVEGGLAWASDTDLDANNVPTGVGNATVDINNFLTIDHKMRYHVGLIFGYDGT
jgi:OOP family OmpA-OmpF porin